MLIRSMSPEIIALDEIGDKGDVDAILYAIKCGVNIIATIHAGEKEELLRKPYIGKLLEEGGFERFVFLGKKEGKCIIKNKLTVGELYD